MITKVTASILRGLQNIHPAAILLISIYLLGGIRADAQVAGLWTWVNGDSTANNPSVYGTKGVAAAGNKFGMRNAQSSWADTSGNFWVFGGEDFNGSAYDLHNDLWMYNPTTNLWTWVSGDSTINSAGVYGGKGVASPTNKPGAREGQTSWVDAAGNFWLFGGTGIDANGVQGYLNDLWVYSPGIREWTWVSGDNMIVSFASFFYGNPGVYGTRNVPAASNKPGGRHYQNSWVDTAGNFWLFGGTGLDAADNGGDLGDLWKFDPALGEWAWVSGDSLAEGAVVYGTAGVPAAGNKPGGRYGDANWIDGSGNFWIFGGRTRINYYNDLWEFNTTTGLWVWVSGTNVTNGPGVYGTKGTGNSATVPGARVAMVNWIDGGGNLWLYGGGGYDGAGHLGDENDLWEYTMSSNQWTWVDGATTRNYAGVFGTKGVAAATNEPPARDNASGWVDGHGNLWVLGGFENLNDLWKFTPLNILAVHGLQLQGVSQGGENLLTWETTNEAQGAGFELERGTNGQRFAALGNVAGAGSGSQAYHFTDAAPPAGQTAFYRVRMTDAEGNSSYSEIISLIQPGGGCLTAYPNPAGQGTTVHIGDADLLNTPVKLLDLNGRLIREQMITTTQQYIDLYDVPAGIYLLQFVNGTTIKIIKV